jgi:hypothetical protein
MTLKPPVDPNLPFETQVYVYNVQTYGARGNGTTNDTTAIQAAITACSAAGGGIVFVPEGTYKCTSTLTLKREVTLRGVGKTASVLSFGSDLGAGQFAIDHAGSPAIQAEAPHMESIGVVGPGGHSLGSIGAVMGGVRLGPNSDMTDVAVTEFGKGGVVFNYDHNTLTRCKIASNYWNLLWPDSPASKGNHTFLATVFDGAYYACAMVLGNNIIDGANFTGGHCGYSPYGFIKDDGPTTGASQLGFMSETSFTNLAFENIGHAAFWDKSTGAGSGADSMKAITIDNPGFSWGGVGYEIGDVKDWPIKIRNVALTRLRQGSYPFTAGTAGVIKCTGGAGWDIDYGNSVSIGADLFGDGITNSTAYLGAIVRVDNAVAIMATAVNTISRGDILEWQGSGYSVGRLGGNGTDGRYGATHAIAGVAAADAVNNQPVPVYYDGHAQVLCESINQGVRVYPVEGTLHHGAPAQSTPNGHGSIGSTVFNGGGVGGSLVEVALDISQARDPKFVLPGKVAALPAASSTYRGQILRVEGGAGVADALKICEKNAADAYAWRTI